MIENKTQEIKNEFDLEDLPTKFLEGLNQGIPNLQLPDKYLRNYYRDEEDRVIWIDSDVDDDTLDVVQRIMYYNKLDKDVDINMRKPIRIFINTLGGSVPIMWTIVQAINMSKTPVYTINWCNALSAGAHILAAGHKRFAMPGSTILIHSGCCLYSGTAEQADNAKKYYDSVSKKADAELMNSTKIDPKVFKKKSPFDWYIDAEEALNYGIIDKIVSDFEEIM